MVLEEEGQTLEGLAIVLVVRGSRGSHFWTEGEKASIQ